MFRVSAAFCANVRVSLGMSALFVMILRQPKVRRPNKSCNRKEGRPPFEYDHCNERSGRSLLVTPYARMLSSKIRTFRRVHSPNAGADRGG
jgi:hypothetical protein